MANTAEEIQKLALIIDPHADELDDRDAYKLFDAARRVWLAGYRPVMTPKTEKDK